MITERKPRTFRQRVAAQGYARQARYAPLPEPDPETDIAQDPIAYPLVSGGQGHTSASLRHSAANVGAALGMALIIAGFVIGGALMHGHIR
jgi:hypothetical protein